MHSSSRHCKTTPPLVFGEAVSHGLFPIVRESAGLPELVKLVGQGSTFSTPEGLRQPLESCVALDSTDRTTLRCNIAKNAQRAFNPATIAQQHVELYESALAL